MTLIESYAAIFIIETIENAFTYSYDCVDDHEWNESRVAESQLTAHRTYLKQLEASKT